MKFRDLKEYEAFRIKGVGENLVKCGHYALRYNESGMLLGRLEMTDETEVIARAERA